MPTHAVLSLYIWQIYHNTWIFPGLESRERLSDPKQEVFLITITTKGKQNQCNPKAGEDEVLKIRIQREPVLICLQIMKIKLRNYRHNFLERCHIKTYGISRSKDDDWKHKTNPWIDCPSQVGRFGCDSPGASSIPLPTGPEGGNCLVNKGGLRIKIMGKLYESQAYLNEISNV